MHRTWRYVLISIVFSVWVVLSGCRFPWPVQPHSVESAPSPADRKAYATATSAYQTGDYARAAKRFTAIREETSDRRMARMALFGLACSKVMLAETPEAYTQALELWESWIDNAPDMSHSEDARFLDPLLREKMLFSNLPPKKEKAEDVELEVEASRWLFIRTKQELDRLRDELKTAEHTNLKRQKKIRSLEKEISKLKQQIIALEAIDQTIQEKKTTIPAAE